MNKNKNRHVAIKFLETARKATFEDCTINGGIDLAGSGHKFIHTSINVFKQEHPFWFWFASAGTLIGLLTSLMFLAQFFGYLPLSLKDNIVALSGPGAEKQQGMALVASPLQLKSGYISEKTNKYDISIKVPIFNNSKIDDIVRSAIDEKIEKIKYNHSLDKDEYIQKLTLYGDYETPYVSDSIISIKFNLGQSYIFSDGGSSMGNLNLAYGINIDTKNNKVITLSDELKSFGINIRQLSERIKEKLFEKYKIRDLHSDTGLDPFGSNYSEFVISDERVTFLFQGFQIDSLGKCMPEISFTTDGGFLDITDATNWCSGN
ncbi:MAG: hypothetical protein NTZ13_02155 [Candidatus Parcubacteria bacterium]|nr:hypothetical protein [Candidatus Parcubacteria bacterium]